MSMFACLQRTQQCSHRLQINSISSRNFSAHSKRKTKAHDLLFKDTAIVQPVKQNPVETIEKKTKEKVPKSSAAKTDSVKASVPKGSNAATPVKPVKESGTRVFHDPTTGISMGISKEWMDTSFMKPLAGKKDKGVSKGGKAKQSVFEESESEDYDFFFEEMDKIDEHAFDEKTMQNLREKALSRKGLDLSKLPSPGAKATVNLMGRDVSIDGLTQEQVDSLLAEDDEEDSESSDGYVSEEDLKRIGLSRAELDMDSIPRIEMFSQPLPEQLPFPTRVVYDMDMKAPFSTLTSEIPFRMDTSEQAMSLRVCIVGTPNAGKSVFVNSMSRVKVTAVSPKRNTTRRQTVGVATEGHTQVVQFDTPGINEVVAAKQYQRDLATEAWDAVGDADMVLIVMDAAKHMGGPEQFLLNKCKEMAAEYPNIKWVLVLNKIDLVEPKDRQMVYQNRVLVLLPDVIDCFMISSLTSDGVADIENYLFNNALPREWEHEEDVRTDQTEVQHATEIIREALYNRLNKEIPYRVQQENIGFDVLRNGEIRIDQRIVVRRQTHKEIIQGTNGNALKAITQTATRNLEAAFGRKVHLFMRVNVNENQDFSSR